MDANFLKFKKKVWLTILIKCLAAGLAVGLVAVIAVLLPCRLYGIKLFWLYYVLIALGGIVLGGGIAFLFLRTNDKKIAKRLDNEFQLAERVQTSLEYSGKSGEMYEIQRADASEALKAKPVKALPFKNVIATALCGFIFLAGMVAVPVVATTVPPVFAKTEEGPAEPDPPREISDWEWAALDDLIDYVKASKKADNYMKTGVVKHLQGLKDVLLRGVSQSSLKAFVQNTVNEIRNTVKDAKDMGISDEQIALNAEEEAYIIAKLYEIFSLGQPEEGGDTEEPPKEDENDPSGKPSSGPGSANINEMPFFDPEEGYVMCGEKRAEYYERVQQALNEGTISKEEWEYIMITYFGDLSGNEE